MHQKINKLKTNLVSIKVHAAKHFGCGFEYTGENVWLDCQQLLSQNEAIITIKAKRHFGGHQATLHSNSSGNLTQKLTRQPGVGTQKAVLAQQLYVTFSNFFWFCFLVCLLTDRGRHFQDCRIGMEPECLFLSGSDQSCILKYFDGASLDLD